MISYIFLKKKSKNFVNIPSSCSCMWARSCPEIIWGIYIKSYKNEYILHNTICMLQHYINNIKKIIPHHTQNFDLQIGYKLIENRLIMYFLNYH